MSLKGSFTFNFSVKKEMGAILHEILSSPMITKLPHNFEFWQSPIYKFFSFMDHTFDVKSKKSLPHAKYLRFYLMFSSKSFMFYMYI